MSTFDALAARVNELVDEALADATVVNAEKLGLDPRCGVAIVLDNAIVVHRLNRNILEYYGGFEYVDRECVTVMGDYVFYLAGDDRVAGCLDHLEKAEAAQ